MKLTLIITLSIFSFFILKAQPQKELFLLNDSVRILNQLVTFQGVHKDKILLFKYKCEKEYMITLSSDTLKIWLFEDSNNIMECVFNQDITHSYFSIIDSAALSEMKTKKMFFNEIVGLDSHCYASKMGEMCIDINLNALFISAANPDGLDVFVQHINKIPFRIIIRSDVFFYNPGYALFFEMEVIKIKKLWSTIYEIHIKTLSEDYTKNKENIFVFSKPALSKKIKLKKVK